MTRKRLLVMTYHFPPSAATGSYRLLGLARHLPEFGWDVIVVAPPRTPFEPQDADLLKEVPPETTVFAAPYPELDWGKLARRLAPDGVWLPAALSACSRAIARYRPAAVLTSSPPHTVHIGGYALKRYHRLPWIADFRDPWISSNAASQDRTLMTHWDRFWEKRVLRAADRVIANAPNASRTLQNAFPQHADKIATVTNGFDPERFAPVSASREGPIRLLHSGELYWERDPRPLLKALADLQRQRPGEARRLQVHFQGQLHIADFNPVEHFGGQGLEGTAYFEGQVPYRQALEHMVRADILVLINGPGRQTGVPAKLYEYLGARRPILALAEPGSDTDWVLRESGVLHRLVPPGDVPSIRQGLLELVEAVEQNRAAPVSKSLSCFTRKHMAMEIAGLLDECAAPVASRQLFRPCAPLAAPTSGA